TLGHSCHDLLHYRNWLYQGEPYMPLTQLAKGGARGAQQSRALQQLKAEVYGVVISLRQRCPYKHAALAVWHIPANGAQATTKGVPSGLVLGTIACDTVLRPVEGSNGSVL